MNVPLVAADELEVLEKVAQLPIAEWTYKTNEDGVRHLGPMAQDFREAFGLEDDEKHLATLNTSGVALAAIQGLNAKLVEKDAEIEALKAELLEIRQMLAR
jgi:hypothetical protein